METPNPNPHDTAAAAAANGSTTNTTSLSQRQKWCIHEYLYSFRGFWFILPYLEATLRLLPSSSAAAATAFHPLPSDVILATFPKSGTTWLKALLHSLLHGTAALSTTHPQELVPSLETLLFLLPGPNPSHHRPPPPHHPRRVFGTHLPYQIIGETLTPCNKLVYIARNPKDVLISLWHFVKKSPSFEHDPWDLDAAVDQFCSGRVPFGPYYDHVLRYREAALARPDRVLFLTYEEMKAEPVRQVARLAEFVGSRAATTEAEAAEIVAACSIERLRGVEVNKSTEMPYGGFPMANEAFFRKGEVGDHKNYLTAEMVARIDALTRDKFYANGFHYGI